MNIEKFIFCLNIQTSSFPLALETKLRKMTINVVTLRPPAVEPELPPMNIKIIIKDFEADVN